ncbi:protein Yim1p [[Candida] railenensis]|uniref:Protein Yim1p n=1 Tax=[Candida] railenensis TaxID=45579 RepID=A0A9P0QK95_9ASCO|nr:protein Yim1p [[Candida] railenensis]
MTLTSPNLTFKSLSYSSNREKISIGEDTIQLVANKDGTYDVPEKKILVRVHSAALNPVDMILYNSAHPILSYFFGKQGIGRDYSGTIEKIGAVAGKKFDFKVGDEVCGLYRHPFGKGTCSEYILIDPAVDKAIGLKPKNLTMEEASSWPLVYGTAESMLGVRTAKNKPKFNKESKVLIIGASTSVGRYLLQICSKKYHMRDIVAVCSPKSEQAVRELGATSIIDYTKLSKDQGGIYPPAQELAVSGKFDMILDCVGNSDFLDDTRMDHTLKSNGDYVTICGDDKNEYGSNSMLNSMKNLDPLFRMIRKFFGWLPYSYQLVFTEPEKEWIDSGIEGFEDGSLQVQIDSVYEFIDYEKAIERLNSNRATGKVVIKI